MRFIEDLDVKGKTVFLRVDFNVPLNEDGTIRNDKRIKASLPTITYLLSKGAKLILASHLGRPKGKPDPKMSLKPVAARLSELIGRDVIMAPDLIGPEVDALKASLKEGQALLLENVRFHPGETKNDPALSKALAEGVDIFINDAFGSSHRAHASVVGIVDFVPVAAAGYLMKKEVDNLRKAIVNPAKPYVAILGGAKTEDKIPVIETLLDKADTILIGGAMAYTFFLAQGRQVGTSLVEPDKVDVAKDILKKAAQEGIQFLLPVDNLMTKSIESGVVEKVQETFPYPAELMGVDIGPKTIALYAGIIAKAKTIFWNGPLGVFEVPAFAQGTIKVAEAVAASGAVSIIGGGDSIAAVDKAGVSSKITHISTGGGASLEFVANRTLPGIEALEKKA
ncbi:MAG: phosphoglycerate kinase [Candidatus Aminicenantes bacterium]|nr:phosphoglycerate kinase [Candidatus Aminicenantes bacterium]